MYQPKKYLQIFLYMSTKYCESFKSFGELGKKIFISNFYDPEIPAKNLSFSSTKLDRPSGQSWGMAKRKRACPVDQDFLQNMTKRKRVHLATEDLFPEQA